MESSNDDDLGYFKRQHGSEAFLCRYPNCPNTIRGFSSADLRHQHETTHAQRYHCIHSECGMSVWTFNSRAGLRSHNAKYHSKDTANQVPDAITRRSRQDEEKPLFYFDHRSSDDEEQRNENFSRNFADVGNALGELNLEDLPSDRKQKCNYFDIIHNPMTPRTVALECNTLLHHMDFEVRRVCLGPRDQISVGYGDRIEIVPSSSPERQIIRPPPITTMYLIRIMKDHCFSPCGAFLAIAWGSEVLRVSMSVTVTVETS